MPPLDCTGCSVCCQGAVIFIHPELGDDPTRYETVDVGDTKILAHKPNGECVYLDAGRCSIYQDRPAICREFDCRGLVAMRPRREIQAMVSKGILSREVVRAGRKRLARERA